LSEAVGGLDMELPNLRIGNDFWYVEAFVGDSVLLIQQGDKERFYALAPQDAGILTVVRYAKEDSQEISEEQSLRLVADAVAQLAS